MSAKKIENEKISSTQFFKSVQNSVQVNNKLKYTPDSTINENNNLKNELENEGKSTPLLKIESVI